MLVCTKGYKKKKKYVEEEQKRRGKVEGEGGEGVNVGDAWDEWVGKKKKGGLME